MEFHQKKLFPLFAITAMGKMKELYRAVDDGKPMAIRS
jgi:hypothetical protein